MSRTVTEERTFSGHPVSYDETDHNWYSSSDMANGYTDSSSGTYATINDARGSRVSTHAYFEFDTSSIPDGVTIESVACTAKCVMSGNNTNVPTKQIQMYSGTTAKGSAFTGLGTSTTVRTLSVGSWTLAELREARIWVNAVRGTNLTSTNYYIRFYGATLTVKYTTIVTYYSVSASAQSISGVTITSSDEYESGNNAVITISGASGKVFTVKDNDVDVTAELTVSGDDYIYTIPSIDADHEILVIGNEVVGQNIYVKENGAWLKAAKIFVKQNGVWKEGKMFVKGSGTWKS